MASRTSRALATAVIASALAAGLAAQQAYAVAAPTQATATLKQGTLQFVASPPALTWTGLLNGQEQTLTTTEPIDVSDSTGSGAGWIIGVSATQFTNAGSQTLPLSSASIPSTITTASGTTNSVTVACDSDATGCVPATGNLVTYPFQVPTGPSASSNPMFTAAANSGMGNQTVTVGFAVEIPPNAYAGSYGATWTFTLQGGPQ